MTSFTSKRTGPGILTLIRRADAMNRSQPVITIVTILMVCGMMIAVLLTTGRTVGAEKSVVSTLDDVGTKSLTIYAEPDAGLTTKSLENIQRVEGVEWFAAFGPVQDGYSTLSPSGGPVAVRQFWGMSIPGIPEYHQRSDGQLEGYAARDAVQQMRLEAAIGGAQLTDGRVYSLMGSFIPPENLGHLGSSVLVPAPAEDHEGRHQTVSMMTVVAEDPGYIGALNDAIPAVLEVTDPQFIRVETSQQMAQLRSAVQGQLGQFGRFLVLAILGLTGLLTAVILSGLMMLRRKDFGRRRALGASRWMILTLVLCQFTELSVIGSLVGTLIGGGALWLLGDPLPDWSFFLALSILAIITSLLAALIPAMIASRRDPLRELRVP